MKTRPYQMCSRCVMDTSDPDIQFDANGVCNHCHNYDAASTTHTFSGRAGENKLKEIVTRIKADGVGKPYDCVLGLSGGVDSTFVAFKAKQLGLRPLAVHMDNGWDSELAIKNIENACSRLDIDLHTVVLDWDEFKDLQLAFLKASTPDSEIPSDHAIVAVNLLTARERGVNYVLFGYNARTEGHLPKAWSQGYFDWKYITSIQKRFGTRKLKTFPHMNIVSFYYLRKRVSQINILEYLDYSKPAAMKILEKELGWRYYGGKHHESIYTRFFQGYILPRKFGFDKRRAHLSSLICCGEISQEQALKELQDPPYPIAQQNEDRQYVIKKLCISEQEFEQIMAAPPKTFDMYPSYAKLYSNQTYRKCRNLFGRLFESEAQS